jgi:hypothetical protein
MRASADDKPVSASDGPGIEWVARKTGRSPEELTASPQGAIGALGDALREVIALAARMKSDDPQVRVGAQAEAATLQEQFAAAPRPADRFLSQVAAALRDTAERLRPESPKPDDPA